MRALTTLLEATSATKSAALMQEENILIESVCSHKEERRGSIPPLSLYALANSNFGKHSFSNFGKHSLSSTAFSLSRNFFFLNF
jgi:hypothetical protein